MADGGKEPDALDPLVRREVGFAQRVSERAQVRTTLEAFVNFPGPAFLEVLIDQNSHVYPMVGPGMGYKDMITGKYITPRQAKAGKIDTTGSF